MKNIFKILLVILGAFLIIFAGFNTYSNLKNSNALNNTTYPQVNEFYLQTQPSGQFVLFNTYDLRQFTSSIEQENYNVQAPENGFYNGYYQNANTLNMQNFSFHNQVGFTWHTDYSFNTTSDEFYITQIRFYQPAPRLEGTFLTPGFAIQDVTQQPDFLFRFQKDYVITPLNNISITQNNIINNVQPLNIFGNPATLNNTNILLNLIEITINFEPILVTPNDPTASYVFQMSYSVDAGVYGGVTWSSDDFFNAVYGRLNGGSIRFPTDLRTYMGRRNIAYRNSNDDLIYLTGNITSNNDFVNNVLNIYLVNDGVITPRPNIELNINVELVLPPDPPPDWGTDLTIGMLQLIELMFHMARATGNFSLGFVTVGDLCIFFLGMSLFFWVANGFNGTIISSAIREEELNEKKRK